MTRRPQMMSMFVPSVVGARRPSVSRVGGRRLRSLFICIYRADDALLRRDRRGRPCCRTAPAYLALRQVKNLWRPRGPWGWLGRCASNSGIPLTRNPQRACYDVMLAAHKVDEPVEPPMSYGHVQHVPPRGLGQDARRGLGAPSDDDGTVAGFYRMDLPDLENLDRATGGPVVHPAVRRRGIGRELLRHEGERAAANGRSLFERCGERRLCRGRVRAGGRGAA